MFTETNAKRFTDAYMETMIWCSEPDDGEWFGASVSDEWRERARIECRAFLYRFACFIDAEPTAPGMAQAGHDFALTRNGHGAGFWDGDWPVYGEMLTKGSKSFGELDTCLGDDGQLWA